MRRYGKFNGGKSYEKEPHSFPHVGGGITVLLVLVSLIACSESSKSPSDETDVTVEVSLKDGNGTASRSLTATNESYELEPSGNLYWTYTAVKKDSYFTTGQVTEETALNEGTLGLPDGTFGKFSVGTWLFQFYAYEVSETDSSDDAVATVTTDDGTKYYAKGDLYYNGESYNGEDCYTTLSSGGENTVSVSVSLVAATGDTGTVTFSGIYFVSVDDEGNETVETLGASSLEDAGVTLSVLLDNEEVTTDTSILDTSKVLASSSETSDGSVTVSVSTGYHTVQVIFYSSDGTVLAESSVTVFVKPNLDTAVTGSLEVVTTEAGLDDDADVSYASITVSSAEALVAALSDSEISTVVLSEDISSSSTFSVTSDKTIDLNGNDMEISNYGFFLYDGASLTIVDGSDEDEGSIYASYYAAYMLGTSSLTIEGGTLSSYYDAVLVYGDDATIAISGGTVSSTSGAAVWVYGGDSEITVSGGILSAESDSAIYIQDGNSTVTITGGEISGANGLVVMNTVDSADITISGGTITGSSYALTVNGQVTSETPVTLTVTDGEFNGLVYLAGYCTTVISGGTFTSDVMQALHMRSGSLNVTGGTFKGTQPESGYDYEYIYAGGGSAALYGDIAIEASSGYPLLSAAVAGSGVSLQSGDYYGIHYYLDPEYDDSTPELDIDTSLNYTAHTGLVYRRNVTTSGYTSWYLYYSSAEDATATTYTVTIYGEDYTLSLGDLEVQDSSSSTGWSTYNSSSEE